MNTALLFGAGLCYLAVCFGVLLLLFGDPSSDSLLGAATRFVLNAPSLILDSRLCRGLIGSRNVDRLKRCAKYAFEEPNPLLQIAYLLMVGGGYALMINVGYPRIPCPRLSWYHKYAGLASFALTLASFCVASRSPPGYIFDENSAKRHDNYPYDDVLFAPGKICPTTRTRKIARSKFCVTRRLCVARFDHFCPWVNASIGEENYRYFLFFLLCNCWLLAYGTVASALLLFDASDDLWDTVFFESATGRTLKATPMVVGRYLLSVERGLTALFLVCLVMGLMVAGFLSFHAWLILNGKTTNEYYKWQRLPPESKKKAENIYNRGFFANVGEVISPLSLRTVKPRRDAWGQDRHFS